VKDLGSTEPLGASDNGIKDDALVLALRDLDLDVVEIDDPHEVPEPTFHPFQRLSAELRMMVVHQYLLLEREADRLSEYIHHDEFGNRCCILEYPKLLIACDNQTQNVFPRLETARAPPGWLPALAFTNKTVFGEVVVYMLQNTERIDLKYIRTNADFKIATWFRKFLASIPGGDGVNAVKYLDFPHKHWLNSVSATAIHTNSSIELMAACLNRRKVDMTFHASKLVKSSGLPCTALDLVENFQLRPMLECEKLENIYFDGIHVGARGGGSPANLEPLVPLARWLLKAFIVRRGQKVEVEVVRRWGRWNGRVAGTFIQLDDEDMADVASKVEKKKGEVEAALRFMKRCGHGLE
jgi:hypothetical protein